MTHKCYLIVELATHPENPVPVFCSARTASAPAHQLSATVAGRLSATVLHSEGSSYQEAHDSLVAYVQRRAAWRWLLPWVQDAQDAAEHAQRIILQEWREEACVLGNQPSPRRALRDVITTAEGATGRLIWALTRTAVTKTRFTVAGDGALVAWGTRFHRCISLPLAVPERPVSGHDTRVRYTTNARFARAHLELLEGGLHSYLNAVRKQTGLSDSEVIARARRGDLPCDQTFADWLYWLDEPLPWTMQASSAVGREGGS